MNWLSKSAEFLQRGRATRSRRSTLADCVPFETSRAFGVATAVALILLAQACRPHVGDLTGDGVVENRGPGLWAAYGREPLVFELEQVFGVDRAPREAILARVDGVAVDHDNNIYVVDGRANRLVSFDQDGAVRWSVGKQGRGPGDISNPSDLVWDGAGSLYVANQHGLQIDRWRTDGTFVSARSLADLQLTGGGSGFGAMLRSRASLAGFLPPATLVLQQQVAGEVSSAVIFLETPDTWSVAKRIVLTAEPTMRLPTRYGSGIDVRLEGNSLVAGNRTSYLLRQFDLSGIPITGASRDVDYISPPAVLDEDGNTGIAPLGSLEAPLRLATGHWIAFARWPTNVEDPEALLRGVKPGTGALRHVLDDVEWACSIDLFDEEWRFLGSNRWNGATRPPIGVPRAVGADGRLYTVSPDPFPQVRRYRVRLPSARS